MASKEKTLFFRDDGTILVKNVRLAYEHCFAPWRKTEKEKLKYSGRFLLDGKDRADDIKALREHNKKLQQEHFKGNIKPADLYFRDGDQAGKEEFEGMWYIAASENEDRPPQLLRPDKKPCKKSDDLIYSGAMVNVIIRPWAQNNDHGKKLNANLLVVQHKAHNEKFGNGGSSNVDTDGLDDEEFEGAEDDGLDDDDGFGGDDD